MLAVIILVYILNIKEEKAVSKEENLPEINEDAKLCEKCGSALAEEDGSWVCPHCDGEIDFMGGDDD